MVSVLFSEPKIPQYGEEILAFGKATCFSALQRAENSSMLSETSCDCSRQTVSVLFSEPKIPQYASAIADSGTCAAVSVLFSEPKIPQSQADRRVCDAKRLFQCSSASRKFLN